MEGIHQESYKGYSISVYIDEDPQNPVKDWDTDTKFVCFHRNYDLGNVDDFKTPEEALKYLKASPSLVYRPVYLMDHSGLNLRMDPTAFQQCDSARWDWGQVGWVFAEREPGVSEEELVERMQSDVEVYDQYLSGDVYGYVVEHIDNTEESLWGCYGFDYCLEEAQSAVDYLVKKKLQGHLEKVKAWIRNKVPLQYRKACSV